MSYLSQWWSKINESFRQYLCDFKLSIDERMSYLKNFQIFKMLYLSQCNGGCKSVKFSDNLIVTFFTTVHKNLFSLNMLCTPLVWMKIAAVATLYTISGYVINCSVQNFVHCSK